MPANEKSNSPALYDSFIADYYDESPIVRARTQDVAFYREAARDFGDPILELGCGTGVFFERVSVCGADVRGVDLLVELLK